MASGDGYIRPMTLDIDAVSAAIRETAAIEILPRFRRLAPGDVRQKGPNDPVTIADIEAERRLTPILSAMIPGSVVVGEEAAEERPELVEHLAEYAHAWLVDPVDGTANFAAGRARFAVIVALVRGGETVAGWIHDPNTDTMAVTVRGEGAWHEGARLRVAPAAAVGDMTGSLARSLRERLSRRREEGDTGAPREIVRYHCTGLEYLDLARGVLHFARYGGRMKPWDHAAGILMHAEAGGYAAFIEDGRAYAPRLGYVPGPFVAAPDAASWRAVNTVLAAA